MSTTLGTAAPHRAGGSFLSADTAAADVFTREDLSAAQQLLGRLAEDFMRAEVLPQADAIYAQDWTVTRRLLVGLLQVSAVAFAAGAVAVLSVLFLRRMASRKRA